MEKRYQVFVSSTYDDLVEERQEVMQALLELDCLPSGMELFPAADEDQWTLIKRVIDDCDYYIVIIAGRYGSIGPEGKSYTQMEYEYAILKGKPIIAFLYKDLHSLPSSKMEMPEEKRDKLIKFRDLVQKKMCRYWSNADELGSVISRSLVRLIKDKPAVGWVRASLVPDESTSSEILRLKKRITELEELLEKARVEAPKGTENLCQGEDEFIIHFSYTIKDKDYNTKREGREAFKTNWNDIFAILSPRMINEYDERGLREVLKSLYKDSEKQLKGNNDIYTNIDSDDFQTIKVQLSALGLIKKSIKQRSLNNTDTYWTLTPYGENLMVKLRAIRKSQN